MKTIKQLKKKLDKVQRKELRNQIYFIRTAMISYMTVILKEEYEDFVDTDGWIPCYELMMEIADKIIFKKNSEFIKYQSLYAFEPEKNVDYFHKNFNTCYDWYFMDLASKELKKQVEKRS